MKKPWIERVGNFIAGRGFYIVLFLCVAAIGISGYYLYSALGSGGEATPVAQTTQVVVTPTPTPTPSASASAVRPTATPAPSAAPTPTSSATPAPTPSATATPTPSASPSAKTTSVFTWPVKGEVIRDFSLEVLAYDETMGDWRTHCGIDIAAAVGTEVCAISAGIVEGVYKDDLMGTTVVIRHDNGLRSIYSNLAATPTVSVGDTVSTGSVIGSVGSTALAENDHPAHLHLEMSKDGIEVDPAQYLPG